MIKLNKYDEEEMRSYAKKEQQNGRLLYQDFPFLLWAIRNIWYPGSSSIYVSGAGLLTEPLGSFVDFIQGFPDEQTEVWVRKVKDYMNPNSMSEVIKVETHPDYKYNWAKFLCYSVSCELPTHIVVVKKISSESEEFYIFPTSKKLSPFELKKLLWDHRADIE